MSASRKSRLTPESLLLLGALSIAALGALYLGTTDRAAVVERRLSQPLRAEVIASSGFREFLLALRVYHYRTQHRSDAEYRDIFFDTDGWDLYQRGFSYRFRIASLVDGGEEYSLRFEQEPRFSEGDSRKVDIRSDVPGPLGQAIANGAWDGAVSGEEQIAALGALHQTLRELQLKATDLHPQLIGNLQRQRFEVTDKGRSWFELDHEIWTYRPFSSDREEHIKVEDLVLDTRLKRDDPEFRRRVRTLWEYVGGIEGVRVSAYAPHERAVQGLTDS